MTVHSAAILPPTNNFYTLPSEDPLEEETDVDDFVMAGNGNNWTRPFFDLSILTTNVPSRSRPRHGRSSSVATTAELASLVGSVVTMPREAFLKSFTFVGGDSEIHWGIAFGKSTVTKGAFLRNKIRLPVRTIEEDGIFGLSRIRPGDYLKSINGKAVAPSVHQRALAHMKSALKTDGFLTVVTKNREEGADDILVHATIVKPEPGMTLRRLGLKVWFWGYLCIKSIQVDSILSRTALKEGDNIVSINEVVCENLTPKDVAEIVQAFPREITITVLRRKQRGSGDFK